MAVKKVATTHSRFGGSESSHPNVELAALLQTAWDHARLVLSYFIMVVRPIFGLVSAPDQPQALQHPVVIRGARRSVDWLISRFQGTARQPLVLSLFRRFD